MLAKKARYWAMLKCFGRMVLRSLSSKASPQSQQEQTSMTLSRSSLPHFGECLKRIHAQKGVSQREIAEKIGMDAGNYNRLLNRPSMSACTLWTICQALNASFGDIA
jgi:DNA-binding Xre family transcriptional regulator